MRTELAHAKLNLGLAVTARRGDGFHELDTIFARLDLTDELTAHVSAQDHSLSLEVEPGLPGAEQLSPEDNLVLLAAGLFSAETGTGGVSFTLRKRIPLAAGLGGGSADAAAALRLLARLFPEAASEVDLPALAAQLGSDVPFMLLNVPAAHGRGRGERLSELDLPKVNVVLVNPGVQVSAAEAYSWLQNFSRRQKVERVQQALGTGEDPRWQNALQSGVVREQPAVLEAILALRASGLKGVLMSGSGATCFGLAADRVEASRVAEAIALEHPGWWVRTAVACV